MIDFHKLFVMQFLKFGAVGILNTCVHYLVFYFFYTFFGIFYLVSSALGYCAGLINSYFFNRHWTFKSTNRCRKVEFIKFMAVNIFSLGVNLVGLRAFVEFGGFRPEVAQVFAIMFSLAANFTGNKFWTFNSKVSV